MDAIYHTAVLVYGKEFWYGGKLYGSKPGSEEKSFGPVLADDSSMNLEPSSYAGGAIKVVKFGKTDRTRDEWMRFLRNEMTRKYTPEHYDVLSRNCNHFSDDCLRFLTGRALPDAVMKVTSTIRASRTLMTMRPYLNKALGGFGGADDNANSQAISSEDRCEDASIEIPSGPPLSFFEMLSTMVTGKFTKHCRADPGHVVSDRRGAAKGVDPGHVVSFCSGSAKESSSETATVKQRRYRHLQNFEYASKAGWMGPTSSTSNGSGCFL